jgi:hypothetical protein
MICTACNKESNNRRVCPYCFTAYPADGLQGRPSAPAGRGSTSRPVVQAQGMDFGPLEPVRAWFARQTNVVRWSAIGIIVIALLWLFTGDGDAVDPAAGPVAVPANVAVEPMTRESAIEFVRRTRETALVEEQSGEVFVSYPASTFPADESAQLQLATQFVAADEAIEGRKRRIFFHNPSGRRFAQSDGVTGLTVLR